MSRYNIPPRPAQTRKQTEEKSFPWQPLTLLGGMLLISALLLSYKASHR